MDKPRLAIVVPCYNEQEVLPISIPVLIGIIDRMTADGLVAPDSFVLCVDDGSSDATWSILTRMHQSDNRVKAVALAHNRGQQNAILAGLMTARGMADAAVSIDCDLQDDPEKIPEMVRHFVEGKDVVYGVRSSRDTDSWFKRSTAQGFYAFQKALGLNTIYDHADFRLMSRRALDMLAAYDERSLYLRGIMPSLGLPSAIVTYPRSARKAGETKYSLGKMLSLSVDGITSFTAKPMRIIFVVGLILLLLDVFVALWVFTSYFRGLAISGWSSLMLSVWFLGSLILMALGVVGEYVGKIYIEVKHRPRYELGDTLID